MTEPRQHSAPPGDAMVYLVPQEAVLSYDGQEMSLLDLWTVLWRGKWLIFATTALAAAASVAYSLTATKWYLAETLLAPAQQAGSSGLSGAIGSLATLAGVSIGDGTSAESMAMLTSRDFTSEFIEEQKLLAVLLADSPVDGAQSAPDIRDAVKLFSDNVRSVSQDRATGLVTLRVEWKDPDLAAQWANLLVERLNDRMRARALGEAQENIRYLETELAKTSLVTLQQSIGRLLETEFQKVMLARGNEQFAFRVIDRAQPPNSRSRPQRTLIVAVATVVGGMLGAFVILSLHSFRRSRQHDLTITNRSRTSSP